MFESAQTLAPLPGAKLERLRLSLNTPVVALEKLPVGPAAAGIALQRGPERSRLTLAVCSTRSAQAVFFHPERRRDDEPAALLLEAAFSFAEGMGFLFDEDVLERGADAAEARRIWTDFLGDCAPDEDELAAAEGAWEVPAQPGPAAVPAPEPPLLSKFRFLAGRPAERLISAPPPRKRSRGEFVMRLLSRF